MPCVTVQKLLESGLVRGMYSTNSSEVLYNWKKIIKKDTLPKERQFTKVGISNKVNDEVMLKIKEVIIETCLAEAVISRKMVISIETGVLKANNPNSLSELGGNVILSDLWQEAF